MLGFTDYFRSIYSNKLVPDKVAQNEIYSTLRKLMGDQPTNSLETTPPREPNILNYPSKKQIEEEVEDSSSESDTDEEVVEKNIVKSEEKVKPVESTNERIDCSFCHRNFTKFGLKRHIMRCPNNPNVGTTSKTSKKKLKLKEIEK